MTGDLFERPHVADGVIVSERDGRTFQPCAVCGVELVGVPTGAADKLYTFDEGVLVGSGCPGKKRKSAKGAKNATTESE